MINKVNHMTSPHHRLRLALVILSGLVALAAPPTAAADFVYLVSANTTAIAGESGSFDLQLNPGGIGTLPVTATITNFAIDGTGLSLSTTDGNVTGTLSPGPLTINNTQALNDLLENVTFGSSISFTLTLSGPGVSTPDANLPGTSFGLTLYDLNFDPLLTTDPGGTVITINVNPDGSTGVETFPSDDSGGAPVGSAILQTLAVPGPGSLMLLTTAFVALCPYWLVRLNFRTLDTKERRSFPGRPLDQPYSTSTAHTPKWADRRC
jgi:hypothetical protein